MRRISVALGFAVLLASTANGVAAPAEAGILHLRSCSSYYDNASGAWRSSSTAAKLSAANRCGSRGSLQLLAEGASFRGRGARWTTTTPAQIRISGAYISTREVLIAPKAKTDGLAARFEWTTGYLSVQNTGTKCCGGMNYGSGINRALSGSVHSFVIQIRCLLKRCPAVSGQVLDVKGVELTAVDTTPPTITPDETTRNLANEAGRWVRGTWDGGFTADSEAGVCRAELLVDGVVVARGAIYTPRTGSWTQCGAGAGTLGGSGANTVSHTINTTSYANGPLTAEYYASDPAQPANKRATTFHVSVDNSPVSLSLGGPTEALTTDGPQEVRATAIAGPSGVSGIWCSVDAGPWVAHPSATANVAVSTPGLNTVVCYARNNAVDQTGAAARSALQTWRIDIRKPSVSLISINHVADALRCRHRFVRVHIPGHWTTVHYRGHRVRVRVPGQTRRVRVQHCRPHVRTVVVRRGGQTVRERVIELPHHVSSTHERIRFGARATVSGWLGEPGGTALGGQAVEVLTAPADGSGQFRPLRTVRTSASGTWTVNLPPGPSRLIEARYAGNSLLAPSYSNAVAVTVPASLFLRVKPHRTHWGSTIRISGRLRGGYIPESGELVVLRIGWHGGSAEIGHVYTSPTGRFSADYTFLHGTGSETYRIWAQSVRESDYPFAPASSRRVRIHVSS